MQDIMTVNGKPISNFDFNNAVHGYALELHRKPADQLDTKELADVRSLAMEKLVARELIFQEAMAAGIVADEASVELETRKIIDNFPSEEEFYATLKKANIDPLAYHRMVRQDLSVNQMTERKLRDVPEPAEGDIAQLYQQFPDKMVKPGQVRACHLLIKATPENREQALQTIRDLHQRAQQEDFATLAREFSACPSSAAGGDLGFFKRGDMVKSFEDAAFSQPVGVVGDIVETPFGFHLIKVVERKDAEPLSLEEARPQIRRFLKEKHGAQLLKEWVDDLRQKADIEIL